MYQMINDTVIDSAEFAKRIAALAGFELEEDLSKASKRDDVLAYRLSYRTADSEEVNEDVAGEVMEEAEHLLAERMEQVIEEDQSFSVYAYQFDPEEGEVRLLLGIMAYEQAEGKLPEVMDRLLKS